MQSQPSALVLVDPADRTVPPVTPAASDAPTTEELMLRLRQRDVAALEALYDRIAPLALGLACRIVRDRSLAEDIVQEAFLTLWRQPERYDPARGSARGWILAIVHHRSIDRVRRMAVRGPLGELTPDLVDERSVDPAEAAFAAIRGEQLRAALDMLPREQRTAIVLSYVHGRTHAEIAELMGCPLGTVKGRIRIGLEKLRAMAPIVALAGA